jgi:hypothetical protein
MTRSQHPRCADGAVYGRHSARVPAAYTVMCPGGGVIYCCDTDCLQRVLEARSAEACRTCEGMPAAEGVRG